MEPTLDAVMTRLQKVEVKTKESVSAELSRIEDEFDKYIEVLTIRNEACSGIVQFNTEVKTMHQVLVDSIVPQQAEEVVEPKQELKELEIKKEVEPEIVVEEPVVEEPVVEEPVVEEVIEPVEIETESVTVKPRTPKIKMTKSTEP